MLWLWPNNFTGPRVGTQRRTHTLHPAHSTKDAIKSTWLIFAMDLGQLMKSKESLHWTARLTGYIKSRVNWRELRQQHNNDSDLVVVLSSTRPTNCWCPATLRHSGCGRERLIEMERIAASAAAWGERTSCDSSISCSCCSSDSGEQSAAVAVMLLLMLICSITTSLYCCCIGELRLQPRASMSQHLITLRTARVDAIKSRQSSTVKPMLY